MNLENQILKNIRFAATLAEDVSPSSPVVMGGDPALWTERAASLGYHALELHWADPSRIPLLEIAEACRRNGMSIAAFATGKAYVMEGLSLIAAEAEPRRKAIRRLMDFVDAAAPHNATVIIGCVRGNIEDPRRRPEALDLLAESTREIALYAEDKGVGLVFEAINRYENNYLNTAEETAAFIRDYRLPNTKLLLDTFHMNIEEVNLGEAILNSKDLLGYVHIADSNRLYAGAGHTALAEIAEALIETGYTGIISAECLPLPDSHQALKGWMDGVKRAFIKKTAEEEQWKK